MQRWIIFGCLLLALIDTTQEKPVLPSHNWADARFLKTTYDQDLVPFDTEKQLFIQETVYAEIEF